MDERRADPCLFRAALELLRELKGHISPSEMACVSCIYPMTINCFSSIVEAFHVIIRY